MHDCLYKDFTIVNISGAAEDVFSVIFLTKFQLHRLSIISATSACDTAFSAG